VDKKQDHLNDDGTGTAFQPEAHVAMKRPSLALLLTLFVLPFDKSWSFPLVSMKKLKAGASLKSNRNDSSNDDNKQACLVKIPCSYTHDELMDIMSSIKRRRLFHAVQFVDASNRFLDGPFSKALRDPIGLKTCTTTTYSYSKATSMLQLQKSDSGNTDAPRYIPVIPGEEVGILSPLSDITVITMNLDEMLSSDCIIIGCACIEWLVFFGRR
jgi:hypothetical protein